MRRAQGSLEFLLLIGGAVVVAVLVITFILSSGGEGKKSFEEQFGIYEDIMKTSGQLNGQPYSAFSSNAQQTTSTATGDFTAQLSPDGTLTLNDMSPNSFDTIIITSTTITIANTQNYCDSNETDTVCDISSFFANNQLGPETHAITLKMSEAVIGTASFTIYAAVGDGTITLTGSPATYEDGHVDVLYLTKNNSLSYAIAGNKGSKMFEPYIDFDTTPIPDNATIKDVKLNLFVIGLNNTGGLVHTFYRMNAKGHGRSAFDIHKDTGGCADSSYSSDPTNTNYSASSNCYLMQATVLNSTGWKTVDLGTLADHDLQGLLSKDFFTTAIRGPDYTQTYPNDYADIGTEENANKPYLTVTYTQGCTDSDADSYGLTGTDLSGCRGSATIADCDDANPNIYPTNTNTYCDCDATDGYDKGTTEICDNIDNDCDSSIDEDNVCASVTCNNDGIYDLGETCSNCPNDFSCGPGLCYNDQCIIPICISNTDCDDGDTSTTDKCNNPWQYNASCSYIDYWTGVSVTPTCSDGTQIGQCSAAQPTYCCSVNYGGCKIKELVDNCDICGCPSGQTCDGGSKCV